MGVYLVDDDELQARVTGMVAACGIPHGAVTVQVDAGFVVLAGEVSRRRVADTAVRMVRAAPGVVGVRDNLRYLVDDVLVGGANPGVWTGFKP